MIEHDPTRKRKIKDNLISLLIVVVLSLGAWFGVKMLVQKNTGATVTNNSGAASSTKKANATLKLGTTGTGGVNEAGGPPPGF